MAFRWVSAAGAAYLLCAAAPARADSVALDLARTAHGVWTAAQEDEVRARMRALEQRADEVFGALELLLANDPIRAAGVDVSATAGGGLDVSRAASEASAQITAHLDNATCQAVWASLLVRGRTATSLDDRARASGEAAAGVCFPDGIDFGELFPAVRLAAFPMRIAAHAALSKTPALTAARSALRERYSETGWRVALEGMRLLYGEEGTRWIAAAGASVGQNWQWRGLPTGEAARLEVVFDAWFFRIHRRRPPIALADRSVDVFAIGAHGVRDDNGAAVIDFWPLRITGLGLGTDRVLVDLALGISGVGELAANEEQIPTTGLPQVDVAAAHAALHVGDQRRSLAIGYDRGLDTNLLAELVHEDRAWIAGRRGAGRLGFDARAFGGRAIHYFDETTRGQERLVGASLDASYAVRADLAVGVALAATHAFERDAVLDGRVAPGGVRALVAVTATRALYRSQLFPVRSLRPDFLPRRDPAPEPRPRTRSPRRRSPRSRAADGEPLTARRRPLAAGRRPRAADGVFSTGGGHLALTRWSCIPSGRIGQLQVDRERRDRSIERSGGVVDRCS